MGKKFVVPKDNNILKISLDEAMSENYLPYAVEVAKDRALPDVRDGLKPVHRRILYGAHQLKAFPDRPYLKSARIVGDILGKYHPHGDSSVYDAMVILAQDFSTREQLVDGHGNWGSVDGDSAAAMRYTEARLSKISMEMLKDVDKGVVPMVENYSNSEMEPEVLPARFPNLLVNGCFGIAVGLSTNIPPHNLGEVIDGVVALSRNAQLTSKELMDYIKGPDLPTGGILMGVDSIRGAYETGRGKVTLRAKTEIEKLESGRYGIVITEFPYRKNKAKLLHTISEMTGDKRHSKMLEGITDIRDESDRHGIRAVIEFKKSADMKYIEKTLKYLFKKTDLQCNVNFNMISLVNGKPELLDLKSMLYYYLEHQKDVITRRTQKLLEVAEKRFHIVEGLIKAIGIMDEVIKTIRESKSKKDAGVNLMEKFGFSEEQTIAILEMMLYKLTGLEIVTFEKEHKQLKKAIDRYKKILNSESELLKVFRKEILEIKEQFDNPRRTEIIDSVEDAKIDREELIIIEDVMVTLSNEGYVKRIPTKSFNRTNGDVNDIEYREGDFNKYLLKSNTRESLMIFSENGAVYRLNVSDIPEKKWKDKGEKVDVLIKGYKSDKNRIVQAMSIHEFKSDTELIFVSSNGGFRKLGMDELKSNYTKIQCVGLKKEDSLVDVIKLPHGRESGFIDIKTTRGLMYTIEEPNAEKSSRGSTMVSLLPLVVGDNIESIKFSEDYKFETFPLSISKKGEIFKEWKRTEFRVYTESNGFVLVEFSKGVFVTIPSYMLQNLEEGVLLAQVIPDVHQYGNMIGIEAVSRFDFEKEIIIPTEQGLIKRCRLDEVVMKNYDSVQTKVVEGDSILKPIIIEKDVEGHILIATENGRLMKFTNDSLSTIGRTAKGVISISLKEEDRVLYSKFVSGENEKLIVRYNNGTNDEIEIDTIPQKSRGTVGVKITAANDNEGIKSITSL